jgi:hypothetical protein
MGFIKDKEGVGKTRFDVISGLPEKVSLVGKARSRKQVIRIEEIVSYPEFQSSEYYSNFMKPANLHHEVVTFLAEKGYLRLGCESILRPSNMKKRLMR